MRGVACLAALLSVSLLGCEDAKQEEAPSGISAITEAEKAKRSRSPGPGFSSFATTTKTTTQPADVLAAGKNSFAESKVQDADEYGGKKDQKALERKAREAALGLVDKRKEHKKAHHKKEDAEDELMREHMQMVPQNTLDDARASHHWHDAKLAAIEALHRADAPSLEESVAAAKLFREKGLPAEKNAYNTSGAKHELAAMEQEALAASLGLEDQKHKHKAAKPALDLRKPALSFAKLSAEDGAKAAGLDEHAKEQAAVEEKARAASLGLVDAKHRKKADAKPALDLHKLATGEWRTSLSPKDGAGLDEHAKESAKFEQKARAASLGLVGEKKKREKAADAKASALAAFAKHGVVSPGLRDEEVQRASHKAH